jgi:hypothetical protein
VGFSFCFCRRRRRRRKGGNALLCARTRPELNSAEEGG